MSENHELLFMLLDTLMKGKASDAQGVAPAGPPPAEDRPKNIPKEEAPASARTVTPGVVIPKVPMHVFDWRTEAGIAYDPGRRSPAGQTETKSANGASSAGRREQRRTGDGLAFRMPIYRDTKESNSVGGRQGNAMGNNPALGEQPSRDMGRSGSGRPVSSYNNANQPCPYKR